MDHVCKGGVVSASLPSGDRRVGYTEAESFGRAVRAFSASPNTFDVWFKDRMLATTGVDFNNVPADFRPPELLSRHQAWRRTRLDDFGQCDPAGLSPVPGVFTAIEDSTSAVWRCV